MLPGSPSLLDREARGIEGIGTQVHLVAVVVAIAVGVRGAGVRANSGFISVGEPVIVAVDDCGSGGGIICDGGSGIRNDCLAVGSGLDAPIRDAIAVRVPHAGIGPRDKKLVAIGKA